MNRGPGGLQTMGSHREGNECAHTHTRNLLMEMFNSQIPGDSDH